MQKTIIHAIAQEIEREVSPVAALKRQLYAMTDEELDELENAIAIVRRVRRDRDADGGQPAIS